MATRKKSKPAAQAAPTFPDSGLQRVPVDAAKLFTVDEDGVLDSQRMLTAADCKGAFIRVLPSATASDELVAGNAEQWKQWGAAAVRVMPRAQADELRLAQEPAVLEALPPTRQLVLDLIERSTSQRKPQLRALVEELADAEGL
jgi:L-alanine-DL-glutamate epimerase-like enolase superfamily enzyme